MSQKKSFDFLEYMRKPHGFALVLIILGLAGWAAWTVLWARG